MKKIFAITFRDMRLRFTSFTEWLFFLILPILFTLILSGGTGPQADTRIELLVVDQAQTPLSAELLTTLEASESVNPELTDLDDGEQKFDSREISALLIIPAGFDQSALESGTLTLELRQQPNNLNALVAQRAVQAVISRVGQAVDIARNSVAEAEAIRPFESETARQAYFDFLEVRKPRSRRGRKLVAQQQHASAIDAARPIEPPLKERIDAARIEGVGG